MAKRLSTFHYSRGHRWAGDAISVWSVAYDLRWRYVCGERCRELSDGYRRLSISGHTANTASAQANGRSVFDKQAVGGTGRVTTHAIAQRCLESEWRDALKQPRQAPPEHAGRCRTAAWVQL